MPTQPIVMPNASTEPAAYKRVLLELSTRRVVGRRDHGHELAHLNQMLRAAEATR